MRFMTLAAAVLLSAPALGQETSVSEAGRLFEKSCLACHRPPDARFETDRAWLDQVNRTA